jgi:hypothetical protein
MSVNELQLENTEELDEALVGTGGEKRVMQGSSGTATPQGGRTGAVNTIGGAKGSEGRIMQGSSGVKKPEGRPANGMTGKGEDPIMQGSSDVKVPGSKMGMINAMVDAMNGMKKDQLSASFASVFSTLKKGVNEEHAEEEYNENNERIIPSVKAGELDISEDVRALFAGDENLSEEFKDKAVTIFEAAVIAKVNEQIQKVTIDIESEIEVERAQIQEELSAKLDDYLDYVVDNWLEENRLAVEQGLKAQITEDFISGLKKLFVEHYIEVPEEKEEVVETLVQRNEELESDLNGAIEESVELKKQLNAYKRAMVFADISEDLTDTQKEKFKVLAESIELVDEESYMEKLDVIKESYFSGSTKAQALSESAFDEEPIEGDEPKAVPQGMRTYLDAISRSVKNR